MHTQLARRSQEYLVNDGDDGQLSLKSQVEVCYSLGLNALQHIN